MPHGVKGSSKASGDGIISNLRRAFHLRGGRGKEILREAFPRPSAIL
jgi:hypothetical protein